MSIFGRGSESKPGQPPEPARQPAAAAAAAPAPARGGVPNGNCIVGAKTTLKGEVTGEEDVVVEGRIEGTVRLARDLTVAAGGSVEASVNARRITVSGELTGDCKAEERMEITASGKLFGNIKAPKIVIAEGAVFRGSSDMSGGASRK